MQYTPYLILLTTTEGYSLWSTLGATKQNKMDATRTAITTPVIKNTDIGCIASAEAGTLLTI